MATTKRYPSSLSHNPSGPSRPPRAESHPSVDDEVPPPPEFFSLESLLQEAGYKETRVFTPEAERLRNRIAHPDGTTADELADLYQSMGLDPNAPIHVRHLTKPSVPFRSSSSVLRNIALQDSVTNHCTQTSEETKSWWGTFGRAAGSMKSALHSPDSEAAAVGLALAKGGNGVRKAKSNWELSRRQEDVPEAAKTAVVKVKTWSREPPPSLAGLFAPPEPVETPAPRFEDPFDFGSGDHKLQDQDTEDLFAYGLDEGYDSGSMSSSDSMRAESPPLLDTADVLADLGLTSLPGRSLDFNKKIAAADVSAIGARVLASTVQYDDEDDFDSPPSPTTALPRVPSITVQTATPKREKRIEPRPEPIETKVHRIEAKVERIVAKPVERTSVKPLRAAKSTPTLNTRKSRPLLRITPPTAAPPTLQNISPVICDSASNDSVDLPPLPMPPMPSPQTGFSTLTLRARKSLTALRAYWAAADATPEIKDYDTIPGSSDTPILTPRIDWEAQGFNFAGWNSQDEKGRFSSKRDSVDTMAELDPFSETGDIDYTKSFFYKPATPPRGDKRIELRKQRSIKSLRAALRIPVAPPVPPIPEAFRKAAAPSRTPPMSARRLTMEVPAICVHSPGAWEGGRPASPLVLEGEEWEGHEVVKNWGKGVRNGKGKVRPPLKPKKRRYIKYDSDDD